MVLHLIPDPGPDPLAEMQEEMRLLPNDPKPKTLRAGDWAADNREQTITHVQSGCQFRAYPLKAPLVEGLVLPFQRSYEIAVRFAGMRDDAPYPSLDEVCELGRQGLTWILTYTYESTRRAF